MMTSTAAKQRADKLEKMARTAIKQYNDDMAKGGEPLFPDWALDMLGFLDDHDRLVATMARQRMHAVDVIDFETNDVRSSIVQVHRVVPS